MGPPRSCAAAIGALAAMAGAFGIYPAEGAVRAESQRNGRSLV